MEAENK